jgi:hypothetical protein
VRLAALLAFNLAGDGIAVVVDRGIDRDVDIGAAVAFLADDEEFLGQLFVHRFHITDSALIVKARAAPVFEEQENIRIKNGNYVCSVVCLEKSQDGQASSQ